MAGPVYGAVPCRPPAITTDARGGGRRTGIVVAAIRSRRTDRGGRVCETRTVTFFAGARPRAFAHRGWHIGDLEGCENSLAAMTRAVAEGFRYLETDVQVTADGVLVVFHDPVLDRVTDRSGPIGALPFAEVRRALIGGREPVARFDEMLAACPDAYFNVDPKSDAAVEPLLAAVDAADAWDRICFGSFSGRRLAAIRSAAPAHAATSLGPRQVARLVAGSATGLPTGRFTARAAQVPLRHRGVPVVTPAFIRRAHRHDLEVHVWTIDDAALMRQLIRLGVDGLMTDRPDLLRAVLQELGQWV